MDEAGTIRVAVSGAAGRMGQTVCEAVQGADGMQLVARADPSLGVSLAGALASADVDVVVDFTVPTTAVDNIGTCVAAGVHCVVGTTGFDVEEVRRLLEAGEATRPSGPSGAHARSGASAAFGSPGSPEMPASPTRANVLIAPNFAIGAVLLMKFAAEAYRYMGKAEIIELHHDRKLDAPSGTAKHTAEQMHAAAPDQPPPPIHSVRLPGLVAHEEVILGDLGQTLTIRHDSIDRVSFMPGVLLAVRRIGSITEPLTLGLEQLL